MVLPSGHNNYKNKITIDFSLAYLVTSSKQIAQCGQGVWYEVVGGRVVRGYRSASDFIHLFCATCYSF